MTFVCLAKGCSLPVEEAVGRLVPAYEELLGVLGAAGAPEVQMHEPILATSTAEGLQRVFESTYRTLAQVRSCGWGRTVRSG